MNSKNKKIQKIYTRKIHLGNFLYQVLYQGSRKTQWIPYEAALQNVDKLIEFQQSFVGDGPKDTRRNDRIDQYDDQTAKYQPHKMRKIQKQKQNQANQAQSKMIKQIENSTNKLTNGGLEIAQNDFINNPIIQIVLLSKQAKTLNGTLLRLSNRSLKKHAPHILIEFYEQHIILHQQ